MSISTLTPAQLYERIQSRQAVDLIDVRTPMEFQEVHASTARNIPLDQLTSTVLAKDVNRSLYVICRSGGRSWQACEKLLAAGHNGVINIEGGTQAWEKAGLPVVRGKKSISLERQVRIAAGTLVLLGVGLSLFVHPYAIGLSAFVGAGLVFAGITDTCGMGLLLAKMPWNKVEAPACQINPAGS